MNITDLLRLIAGLMSEDGENVEYDGACIQIACAVLSLSTDESEAVERLLRTIARNNR